MNNEIIYHGVTIRIKEKPPLKKMSESDEIAELIYDNALSECKTPFSDLYNFISQKQYIFKATLVEGVSLGDWNPDREEGLELFKVKIDKALNAIGEEFGLKMNKGNTKC